MIIVADDQEVNRKLVCAILDSAGYEVRQATNGAEALAALLEVPTPVVGLIDWEMPEMEGTEVCRQARMKSSGVPMFLILLTVRDSRQDIVAGLEAGANDYVTKPFDRHELLTRIKIGFQMVKLQASLVARVDELDKALTEVRLLGKLLPICSYCKKIRDDKNYWEQVEGYMTKHAQVQFTHGICPACAEAQWGALAIEKTK